MKKTAQTVRITIPAPDAARLLEYLEDCTNGFPDVIAALRAALPDDDTALEALRASA